TNLIWCFANSAFASVTFIGSPFVLVVIGGTTRTTDRTRFDRPALHESLAARRARRHRSSVSSPPRVARARRSSRCTPVRARRVRANHPARRQNPHAARDLRQTHPRRRVSRARRFLPRHRFL